MKMKMPDRLSCSRSVVDYHPVAVLVDASFGGNPAGYYQDVPYETRILTIFYVSELLDVLLGHNENMHRRTRLQVVECSDLVILIHQSTHLAVCDLAEYTVSH
jgi:hypothetical protein